MGTFDLTEYWSLFGVALEERYQRKDRFKDGFERIEALYQQTRPGRGCRDLQPDDVLEIFQDDLPYVQDWSKPDRDDLARRMREHHAAELIRRLGANADDMQLLRKIRYCFRDLGLTSLILHHVYPKYFAMCSHHLASLLSIRGETVTEFYAEYCRELQAWSRHFGDRSPKLNVSETEFALWTWYWFSHQSGNYRERRKHFRAFWQDPWIRDRRAGRIAKDLKGLDRIDLARSYLPTEPTVAAIIAWREFEIQLRKVLADHNSEVYGLVHQLHQDKPEALPSDWAGDTAEDLWYRVGCGRNRVMHGDRTVSLEDAATIVHLVSAFIEHNLPK